MPEVFRFFGYSFFFYSKEHEPLHIHVEGNGGVAKFDWNGEEFEVKERQGIKSNDFKRIKQVIAENSDIITADGTIILIISEEVNDEDKGNMV